jgi:hypothetical protein
VCVCVCVCVCFGVCVNNGDHVGSTRERKVGEVQVGSERGEEYIKQREIGGCVGEGGREDEVSMIGALQV